MSSAESLQNRQDSDSSQILNVWGSLHRPAGLRYQDCTLVCLSQGSRRPKCFSRPNVVAIGQTVAQIWRFIFFQYGSHPPSWICCALVWTTHEEHLVVLIAVQNLVGIGAVVSIICTILHFAHSAWKCLLMPPKLVFWGIWPPKLGRISTKPLQAYSWAERHHMTWYTS